MDLREEFVRDFVFPMFRSGALYEGYYLLGTSIARPLIAKYLVRIAQEEGAQAISHGATGKGNDQVRFELTAYALKPDIRVIAPWREWDLISRPQMMEYAAKHGIPVPTTIEKPYSVDSNLLHNSFEGGVLEDPWNEPPAGMFRLTKDPWDTPGQPELVEIEVQGGDVVGVNGERLSPAQLLARLNEIGGRHAIGRVDLVENRFVGMKSRGVYETPGGTLMYHARRAIESLTVDREVLHQRDQLGAKYAELVYNGFWFAPEREALQTYFDHVAKTVTGTVRFKLYKGNVIIAGRNSPLSLYDKSLVSFDEKGGYNQADADGFIKLNSLRLRVRAKAQPKD